MGKARLMVISLVQRGAIAAPGKQCRPLQGARDSRGSSRNAAASESLPQLQAGHELTAEEMLLAPGNQCTREALAPAKSARTLGKAPALLQCSHPGGLWAWLLQLSRAGQGGQCASWHPQESAWQRAAGRTRVLHQHQPLADSSDPAAPSSLGQRRSHDQPQTLPGTGAVPQRAPGCPHFSTGAKLGAARPTEPLLVSPTLAPAPGHSC